MYEVTDREMEKLTRKMVRRFERLKNKTVLGFDNLNQLKSAINDCYDKVYDDIVSTYYTIASASYADAGGEDSVIDLIWIEHFLKGFDYVTKYIFKNEYERKRARAFEAIAVSKDIKEVEKALELLHRQVKQGADKVTDDATLEAYRSIGIKEVKWVTERMTEYVLSATIWKDRYSRFRMSRTNRTLDADAH